MHKTQQTWDDPYDNPLSQEHFFSDVQGKASWTILNCESGKLGCNISQCPNCGHLKLHNNPRWNCSCPNCQTANKEVWVDK